MTLSLSQANTGDHLTVVTIDASQPEVSERLFALGIFPGVLVQLLHRAPLGDPLQVKAGHTLVSLRKREADTVTVELSLTTQEAS